VIVYVDASALVKLYVAEAGSKEVEAFIGSAQVIGTGIISRAEVAAALGKSSRLELITREGAAKAHKVFSADWESLIRLPVTEALVARAGALAFEQVLRGYDALHLATALAWRETLGEEITLATFDRELWRGAQATGLTPWPGALT
jgi:predicted nucleic acid-binding protein